VKLPLKGGAAKAKRAMKKKYGAKKGTRVFWATAMKRGKGKTRDAKARNAFKRKRKGGRKKRR
jgi:hypothetical protein